MKNERNVKHIGWNWDEIDNPVWEHVSDEFLSIALEWSDCFDNMLDIGAGKGNRRH
ncbi:hypothetical protein [Natronospora cellulosivora (SeqCode)]